MPPCLRTRSAVSASEVVIFGVGAPLTSAVEETCARLGIAVIAGVRNVPGPSFASDALTEGALHRPPNGHSR